MTARVTLKVKKAFVCCSSIDSLWPGDVNQQVILLISRYRRCARLYWGNTNKVPSSWDDTAYQMFKVCCPSCMPLVQYLSYTVEQDRTPLVEPSTAVHRNVPSNDDGGFAANHNRNADGGKTIIRFHVVHGIQVSLNPLVVLVVKLLLQDMVVNVSQMSPFQRMLSQSF